MAHVHVPVGTIGLVIAWVGAPPPPAGQLARHVECAHYQDSSRFLAGGGQQGRQQQVLTNGSYDIDTRMFDVITIANAHLAGPGLTMVDLHEVMIDHGEVGVVIALAGTTPDTDSIGRVVSGHDSFQRPWEFLANGGQRGIQEETLAGGRSYAINPWFAQIARIPTDILTLEWSKKKTPDNSLSSDQIVFESLGRVGYLDLRLSMRIPAAMAPRLVHTLRTPGAMSSTNQSQIAFFLDRALQDIAAEYFNRTARLFDDIRALTDEIRGLLASLGITAIDIVVEQLEWDAPEVDIPQPGIHWMDPSHSEPLETPEEIPISGGHGGTAVLTDTAEVSIYLSEAAAAAGVERAVEGFLALVGAEVVGRDDPVLGSWFRRMQAKVGGEVASSAAHAIDTRFVLAPDAAVARDLMTGLAPVIGALGSVEQAVIRVGALLIVKADGRLSVCQLTAKQQLELDHNPSLATAPHEILGALQFGVNGSPRPIAELDQGRGEGTPGGGGDGEGGTGGVLGVADGGAG